MDEGQEKYAFGCYYVLIILCLFHRWPKEILMRSDQINFKTILVDPKKEFGIYGIY